MTSQELKVKLEALHTLSFAWALRCCGEQTADAQDVLQNTYVKILAGKAQFKQQASFKTWLFSVIKYTAIDHYKAQERNRIVSLDNRDMPIKESFTLSPQEEGGMDDQQRRLFLKGLQQLSKQQQQVLHLVFYQTCTIEEAASIMNIQLGTARTHYERGKKQLKKWLIKTGEYHPIS